MKERIVDQVRQSTATSDGAGVRLNRVFHREDTLKLDPFLMLDTFDSHNPEDYTKGFPTHPHRGIETFTYLVTGDIIHKDSLGNQGRIRDGEYQWMRSGSGILHQEMPQAVDHILGFQLWINMPKSEKMSPPAYQEGTENNIPVVKGSGYTLRLLSGSFGEETKEIPAHVKTDIFDIAMEPDSTLEIPVNFEYKVLVCILQGEAKVADLQMTDKMVATLKDGETVKITTGGAAARVVYFAGKPLNEPIAWGGPIVMNTQEELAQANQDLRNGTFTKHEIKI